MHMFYLIIMNTNKNLYRIVYIMFLYLRIQEHDSYGSCTHIHSTRHCVMYTVFQKDGAQLCEIILLIKLKGKCPINICQKWFVFHLWCCHSWYTQYIYHFLQVLNKPKCYFKNFQNGGWLNFLILNLTEISTYEVLSCLLYTSRCV